MDTLEEQLQELDEAESSTPTEELKEVKRVSWILGIAYGVLVGWDIPSGLQASLINLLFIGILFQRTRSLKIHSGLLNTLLIAGGLNALTYVLVSNYRVQALSDLSGVFIITFCLVALVTRGRIVETPGEFILLSLKACYVTFANFCSLSRHRYLLGTAKRHRGTFDYKKAFAYYIALFFLILFHVLLSEVNDQYMAFISQIVHYIWLAVRYLYELDILTTLFTALFVAYLCSAVLNSIVVPSNHEDEYIIFNFEYLKIIIIPIVCILFVFSLFQSQHFFIDPAGLSYKELALYVQKGFWELLIVASLGATLWYMGYVSLIKKEEGSRYGKFLLVAFTIELLLLSLFSQHKLLTQQVIFGLRDQRLLASAGVLLISLSFLGYLGVALKRTTLARVFSMQYFGLIIVTLTFSYGNLDSFITKTYPLQFTHKGKMHLDFAYLLTNSYDNNADWLPLMEAAYEDGLPLPEDYYWGVYKPLCVYHKKVFKYSASSYKDHIEYLEDKYGSDESSDPRQVLKFNLREWQAHRLIKDNAREFKKFRKFVEKTCDSYFYPYS